MCLCVCARESVIESQRDSETKQGRERAQSLCAFRVQILIRNHFKLINDNNRDGQQRSKRSTLSLCCHHNNGKERAKGW